MLRKILIGEKLKRFNLDFLLFIFNVLALSLFLPQRFLFSYTKLVPWLCFIFVLLIVFILFALYQRKQKQWLKYIVFNNLALKLFYLLLAMLILAYFHAKPLYLLEQSQQFKQGYNYKNYIVRIEKILKKQDFYAFIGAIWIEKDGGLDKNLVYFTINPSYLEKNNLKQQNLEQSDNLDLKIGDVYLVKAKLKPSYSRLNFGGFNRAKWLYAQYIVASGAVKAIDKIDAKTRLEHDYIDKIGLFSQARVNLLAKIDNFYQQHKPELANFSIVFALAFGERFYLTNEQNDLYRKFGVAHLIAISGLHIGLAFLFGYLLLRALNSLLFLAAKSIGLSCFRLNFSSLNLASCIIFGLLFATFYAYLADFSITVNRAILSIFVIYLFVFTRTNNGVWVKFNKVVALLILLDPLSLLSDSMWLSLGAIFCLILWSNLLPLRFFLVKNKEVNHDNFNNIQLYFLKIVHIQLGFLFLFTPIVLYFFNGISISGFFVNLIAIPLFSLLLVPLILLAVVFTLVGVQLDFLYFLSDKIIGYFNFFLLKIDPLWFSLSRQVSLTICILLAFLMFFILLFLGYKTDKNLKNIISIQIFKAKTSLFGLNYNEIKNHFSLKSYIFLAENFTYKTLCLIFCLLCIIPIIYYIYQQHNQPNWQYYSLDIGQGLSNLIVKNNHAILYDTGAAFGDISMFKLETEPLLKRLGVNLDYLIVSHDDNDHSGAAADVITNFKPVYFMNTSDRSYGFTGQKQDCVVGNDFSWQGLTFRVLNPVKIAHERANNDQSCVLLVTDNNGFSLLLAGDITSAIESDLLNNKTLADIGKIDVLQVPHHGSKTSSSYAFLHHLKPSVALNSSGYKNHFSHPNKDVVARYKNLAIDFYDTAKVGASRIDFYQNKFILFNSKNLDSPWYVF